MAEQGGIGGGQWYYQDGDAQGGPVSKAELAHMLRGGMVTASDFVWTEGMPDWKPAGQIFGVPHMQPAANQQAQPVQPLAQQASPTQAGPGSLQYFGPSTATSVEATPAALQSLFGTSGWVRFIAILILVFAGIYCVLTGIGLLALTAAVFSGEDEAIVPLMAAVLGCAISVVYIVVAWHLSKYATHIGQLRRNRSSVDLELALESQRKFWRLMGLIIIVTFVGSLVMGVVIGAVGAM